MKRQIRRRHSVVVTLGPWHRHPWWWEHIDHDDDVCRLDYVRLDYKGKGSQQIKTRELPFVAMKIAAWFFRAGRKYDYIYTFECDLVGWVISALQTALGLRRPHHVILQFIMRERQPVLSSMLKYRVMKWVFSSVYKLVCSSRSEIGYYREAFGWNSDKFTFVPFHTSPEFLAESGERKGDYWLAAGRTFRDYDTLLRAVQGWGGRLILVAGQGAKARYAGYGNIEVMENIPLAELTELMKGCKAVVVPLENRKISIGQSIILQAMAMKKPVVATRTAGTEDYVQHRVTGLLVEPGDAADLRAMLELLDDDAMYRRIADAAHRTVLERHLPRQYANGVRDAISYGKEVML